MKKFFVGLIFCFTIISVCFAADVQVQVNGEILNFTDSQGTVNAQIINDRTMVPFRKIFNSLGVTDDNIEWIPATRTVKARKGNVEIELQIDNRVAKKMVNGIEEKISLDSAPVISNGRTLVPLRFIAESLNKTVGWDATNKTAIIIDYDYFMNAIKNKSNTLYEFLKNDSSNTNITITRKYFDLEDSTKNNEAIVNAQVSENRNGNEIVQNVNVNFSGTNELMKEINSEGWGNVAYKNVYSKNGITTTSISDGAKKIFGVSNQLSYGDLTLSGSYDASAYETFKMLSSIDENKITSSTFTVRKNEFSKLLNMFKLTNENGIIKLSTGNVSTDSIEFTYFDFTQFDNIMWDSSVSRVYTFLNNKIFNYDVKLSELCYDMSRINCEIKLENKSSMTIDFVFANEYNEKVEYLIKIIK